MKFFRYWVPFLAFAGLIFLLSSLPSDKFTSPAPWLARLLPEWLAQNFDKVIHGGEYAILGWLSLRATALGSPLSFPLVAVVAFFICSAYGASDEWHQSFVPGRSCDVWDWLVDSIGSFFAIAAFYKSYANEAKYCFANSS